MSESVAIRIKDTEAQPADAEVEALFERVLTALLIPEAAKEQMIRTESVANKWRMCQLNSALLKSGVGTSFGAEDAALVDSLGSVKSMVSLRKRLATSSRGWVDGFYGRGGLDRLAVALRTWADSHETYTELAAYRVLAAFGCVKALVNHRAGLDRVAASKTGLLDAVARAALKEPETLCGGAVATLGLQLLGVAAHYSVIGDAFRLADDLKRALGLCSTTARPSSSTQPNLKPHRTSSSSFVSSRQTRDVVEDAASGGPNGLDRRDGRLLVDLESDAHLEDPEKTVPKTVIAAALALANELICAESDVASRCALRATLRPLFGQDLVLRVEDADAAHFKRDRAKVQAEFVGELVATKQSSGAKVLGAIGARAKKKRRLYTLRDARLSWTHTTTTTTTTPAQTTTILEEEPSAVDEGHQQAPSLSASKSGHSKPRRRSSGFGFGGPLQTTFSTSTASSVESADKEEDHFVEVTEEAKVVSTDGGSAHEFEFEVWATSRSLELAAASAFERKTWVNALRRCVSRVELAAAIDDADSQAGGSLWERVVAPFEAVYAKAAMTAKAVVEAQKAAFEAIAETDRLESLDETGVDLNDLGAVLRKLEHDAKRNGATRDVLRLATAALRSIAVAEPVEINRNDAFLAAPRRDEDQDEDQGARRRPDSSSTPAEPTSLEEEKSRFEKVGPARATTAAVAEEPEEEGASAPGEDVVDPKTEAASEEVVEVAESQRKKSSPPPPPLPTKAPPAAVLLSPSSSARCPPPPPPRRTSPTTEAAADEAVAKYVRMLKMGLPRGAVEQKMRSEGMDPKVLGEAAGCVEDEAAAARHHSAAAKKTTFGEKPRVAMRAWYWAPLRGSGAGAAWASIAAAGRACELDLDALEAAFARSATPTSTSTATGRGASSADGSSADAAPSFVDPRTAQNCGIVLAKLKRSGRELARRVFAGDFEYVDHAKAEMLKGAAPTTDDLAAAADCGPENLRGPVETFFGECAKVPNYSGRLEALALRGRAGEVLADLDRRLDCVAEACEAVAGSRALRCALAAALKLGNYLNGGTARGAADGFELDGLARLATTKGADGSTLAMHVAALLVAADADAEPAAVLAELERLGRLFTEAAAVSLSAWDADWRGVDRDLRGVAAILDGDSRATAPPERLAFARNFAPFVAETRDALDTVKARKADATDALQAVTDGFHGSNTSLARPVPAELFGDQLGAFVRAVARAAKDNDRRAAAKARAAKEEANLASIQAAPARHRARSRAGSGPEALDAARPAAAATNNFNANKDLFEAFFQIKVDENRVVSEFYKRHDAPTVNKTSGWM